MASVTVVRPRALTYDLLLTADLPISHHDPAVQDDSNRNLFNRQAQIVAVPTASIEIEQPAIDAICQAHLLPSSVADLFADLSFAEFAASALVRSFIDLYNSLDGIGLFAGMERYSRLEARVKQAAISSQRLSRFWDRLCSTMAVPIHGGDHDLPLARLLHLPLGMQTAILDALAEQYRSVVALARLWHSEAKLLAPAYAAASGKEAVKDLLCLGWPAESLRSAGVAARIIQAPAVSGNSLRHQVVREPSWLHLAAHLGLQEETPGRGPLPAGVEAMFYNGGNIAAGAKQPSNTFGLAQRARQAYPSLDLLGGVTDSFDLDAFELVAGGLLTRSLPWEALAILPAGCLPVGEAVPLAWTPPQWKPALFRPGWMAGTPCQ